MPQNDRMETAPSNNVTQIPVDCLMKEGQSQSNRRVQEVMGVLFSKLPDKPGNKNPDFILADGTECRIVKFAAPRERDGEILYGFDVKFNSGPLTHLEFSVRCSGWERDYT
jgi:hypothetical protein